MSARRLTLLTDFGTTDGYAAAVKGVIASICSTVRIDDASHEIPRGDVAAGAWALGGYWHLYPRDTIHVVVVDPGVGTARRALAAEMDGRLFVAPDNGVLSRVLDVAGAVRIVAIDPGSLPGDVASNTFHGRDIFAPAAARLACGALLGELGSAITDPVRLAAARVVRSEEGEIAGEVVHVDRYGNLVTNIPGAWLDGHDSARLGLHTMPIGRTYSDIASGDVLALVGSRGTLEVSVRDGDAAALLQANRGAAVYAVRSRLSGSATGPGRRPA
jgi:S-adenosyl-L-methionine hydrolase (adenosine-forming)